MTTPPPLPQGLPEVLKRIQAALELDSSVNALPALHTIPCVLLRWDFKTGLLRVGFSLQTELEVHIVYLRICDLQLTFGQMVENAAKQAAQQPHLKEIGEVMAGKKVSQLVKFDA